MRTAWKIVRSTAAAFLLTHGIAAIAVEPESNDPGATHSVEGCVNIDSDRSRLACYDTALGRAATPAAKPPEHRVFPHESGAPVIARTEPTTTPAAKHSLLDSRWELDQDSKLGPFHIRAYKPVYLMPAFYTTSLNRYPESPSPNHQVTTAEELDRTEVKYQISLKTKVLENIFGDNGDVWMGYTQVSHWQLYNGTDSRPFRETTYEPDATLIFRTNYDVLGWNGHLFGVGLDHQSNGRPNPFSRSWNRVIANIGFERDGWTLNLRPWWRIHESRRIDDNPDIEDYLGRGDLQLIRVWNGNQFSLMARHSLRGGERSHGAVQFEWAFPIVGELFGHFQLFNGYGESLIDYNHRAWYAGIGVSLLEWY